jgi:hypothetical protein
VTLSFHPDAVWLSATSVGVPPPPVAVPSGSSLGTSTTMAVINPATSTSGR